MSTNDDDNSSGGDLETSQPSQNQGNENPSVSGVFDASIQNSLLNNTSFQTSYYGDSSHLRPSIFPDGKSFQLSPNRTLSPNNKSTGEDLLDDLNNLETLIGNDRNKSLFHSPFEPSDLFVDEDDFQNPDSAPSIIPYQVKTYQGNESIINPNTINASPNLSHSYRSQILNSPAVSPLRSPLKSPLISSYRTILNITSPGSVKLESLVSPPNIQANDTDFHGDSKEDPCFSDEKTISLSKYQELESKLEQLSKRFANISDENLSLKTILTTKEDEINQILATNTSINETNQLLSSQLHDSEIRVKTLVSVLKQVDYSLPALLQPDSVVFDFSSSPIFPIYPNTSNMNSQFNSLVDIFHTFQQLNNKMSTTHSFIQNNIKPIEKRNSNLVENIRQIQQQYSILVENTRSTSITNVSLSKKNKKLSNQLLYINSWVEYLTRCLDTSCQEEINLMLHLDHRSRLLSNSLSNYFGSHFRLIKSSQSITNIVPSLSKELTSLANFVSMFSKSQLFKQHSPNHNQSRLRKSNLAISNFSQATSSSGPHSTIPSNIVSPHQYSSNIHRSPVLGSNSQRSFISSPIKSDNNSLRRNSPEYQALIKKIKQQETVISTLTYLIHTINKAMDAKIQLQTSSDSIAVERISKLILKAQNSIENLNSVVTTNNSP